ncbi:MAG TPA: serine hydrolase [Chitinophagaceae bacterium]|jgi:CubicO group peptidase (beta-lactamase class C family)|nr:serine hydrolase [Chitinophagaceae bacterium]
MKKYALFLILLVVSVSAVAQTPHQKLEELAAAYHRLEKFNGAVLVAHKGHILLEKGYGYLDAEKGIQHEPGDLFQIGSVTKQFTAALVMQQVEEGRLSLQDRLSKFYPAYPNGDKITLEHLLSHTSGIFNYTNDAKLMQGSVTRPITEEAMLATFRDKPLDFEPGAQWNYSNSGYMLLGYILQKVTGKPYEQLMRERILQPLGMQHSGFNFAGLSGDRKSKGYFRLSGGKGLAAPVVDSTFSFAAGALYATVGDLYRWERGISTGKVLKPESWKKVFTPVRNHYGLGWEIDTVYGKTYQAHGGGIHGFTSYLMRFPEEELVVILLDNTSSGNLTPLAKGMAAIVLGKPYEVPEERTAIRLEEAVLQQYTGSYELRPDMVLKVFLQDGKLMTQATNQAAFEIFAESPTRFFVKAFDAQIEFVKDNQGKVTGAILYQGGREVKAPRIQ